MITVLETVMVNMTTVDDETSTLSFSPLVAVSKLTRRSLDHPTGDAVVVVLAARLRRLSRVTSGLIDVPVTKTETGFSKDGNVVTVELEVAELNGGVARC